jgi:hypothetical protein
MSLTTHSKPTPGSVVKRLLVGRAFASHLMEHTLLPKVLAIPVFSSGATALTGVEAISDGVPAFRRRRRRTRR